MSALHDSNYRFAGDVGISAQSMLSFEAQDDPYADVEDMPGKSSQLLLADSQPSRGSTQLGRSDATIPLANKLSNFETASGLNASFVSNSKGPPILDFTLAADGKEINLFQTPYTEAGLSKASRLLNLAVAAKVAELEVGPGKVWICPPGENVVRRQVIDNDGDFQPGDWIKSVAPSLSELYGIEAALRTAIPSNWSERGKPIKLYFLQNQSVEGLSDVASYVRDPKGYPSVYFPPGPIDQLKPTEADLSPAQQQSSWQIEPGAYISGSDTAHPWTIQSIMVHELSHADQDKLGILIKGNELDDADASKMGWVHYVAQGGLVDVWMIKSKDLDAAGEPKLYRLDDSLGLPEWLRCNAEGDFLDSNGKRASWNAIEFLDSDQIMKNAVVPPATWYFTNPCEEYAEAMKLYRLNEESRKFLLQKSPVLYRLIQQKDEQDIQLTYGKHSLVRDPDGSLLAESRFEDKKIADFESRI